LTSAGYDAGVGRYSTALARAFVAELPLERGARAIDVGCGTGALTWVLAERLGPDAVAAVDPSEEYVATCRARVPGADARVASAERLPFPDASFDAALAQLVLNLVPDRGAAAGELARVVRRGGVVAVSGWTPGRMPFLDAFWGSAELVAPDRVAAVPEHERVGFATAAEAATLLERAGAPLAHEGRLRVEAEYADAEDLWAPFEAGAGRSGKLYLSLGADARARLRRETLRRLGDPSGGFRLDAEAWYVVARV
jgi:SAM-dependent methyltransferase